METKIWTLNRFERKEQKTGTGGFLLEEMNIDKLRNRLRDLKAEEARLVELKRQSILDKAAKEKQELEEIKNKVAAKREQKNKEMHIEMKQKHLTKLAETHKQEKPTQEQELETLTKILAKKEQKAADIKEMKRLEKESKIKKQFMNQEKDK